MALKTYSTFRGVLVGLDAKDYKAGTTDDGTRFDAGRSVKVWIADPATLSCEMFKASRDNCHQVEAAAILAGFGGDVEIDFDPRSFGSQARTLMGLRNRTAAPVK